MINSYIFIPGMYGMVGGSLYRQFTKKKFKFLHPGSLNFLNWTDLKRLLNNRKVGTTFLCASKVGGIEANLKYPVNFLQKNISIVENLISCAYLSGCTDLIYFGSSCIFPKKSPQPMKERYLLKGSLEFTNEAYALAKLTGSKLCEYYNRQYGVNYRTVLPASLFGRGDNFNLKYAHVIPSLIKKLYTNKLTRVNLFNVWGTGVPLREFFDVDLCSKLLLSNLNFNAQVLNLGSGHEISIKNLVGIVKKLIDFTGDVVFNKNRPDGMLRKYVHTSVKDINCGGSGRSFYRSLQFMYRDFLTRRAFL